METKLVNSIKKAFDIMDILVFEDIYNKGISLTKLSEKTEIKPNTLHNILKTMIHCGYIEQNESTHYLSGKRCKQIGIINKFQITPKISSSLNSTLYALCSKTDESVSFYVLDNGERINYTNVESKNIIKVDYTMLEENSIYDYPSGKILVAYCNEENLKLIIKKHGFPKERWNNIFTMADLQIEIEKIQAKGYCDKISSSGKVASYAVPCFMQSGELLGTIGVYMPAFRADKEKSELVIKELKLAADNIKINS